MNKNYSSQITGPSFNRDNSSYQLEMFLKQVNKEIVEIRRTTEMNKQCEISKTKENAFNVWLFMMLIVSIVSVLVGSSTTISGGILVFVLGLFVISFLVGLWVTIKND